MTDQDRQQTLDELRTMLEYKHRRLTAILKNKGLDRFCSSCYQPSDTNQCHYCGGSTLEISEARSKIEEEISAIADLIKLSKVRTDEGRSVFSTKREKDPADPEDGTTEGLAQILVMIINKQGEQTSHNFTDPRKARKWLRDQNLSVRDAIRIGQTWTIDLRP